MAGKAAYPKIVKVSADNGVTWQILPATGPSLDLGGDVLDDTDMSSNAGWRSRCLGLHDWSVKCDSNWSSGHAGLGLVRTAKLGRSALKVAYLPDGVAGYMGDCVVESFNHAGEVGGLETISITLQAKGALVAYA